MESSPRLHPSFWNHQYHPLARLREALDRVLDEIPPASAEGRQVIDLGCGASPYRPMFLARGFGYVGCDLAGSPDLLIGEDGRVPLGDEVAAGVVSFQVLEHVWNIDEYLGECHRLCRRGGWLILSTHGTWPYHPHPTDYRRWTRDGLTQELTGRGFDVVKVIAILGPLAWTSQIRLLGFRAVLLRLPFGRLLSGLCAVLMNLRIGIEERLTPARFRDTNACVYLTLSKKRP